MTDEKRLPGKLTNGRMTVQDQDGVHLRIQNFEDGGARFTTFTSKGAQQQVDLTSDQALGAIRFLSADLGFLKEAEEKVEELQRSLENSREELAAKELLFGELNEKYLLLGQQLDQTAMALAAYRIADAYQKDFIADQEQLEKARDKAHESNAKMVKAQGDLKSWEHVAEKAIKDYNIKID